MVHSWASHCRETSLTRSPTVPVLDSQLEVLPRTLARPGKLVPRWRHRLSPVRSIRRMRSRWYKGFLGASRTPLMR
ncbi:Uncharacterised protein [Mycobacteroides abscessus subsp. abscessus]|nr:Uncharacterised protein [Mycobacteroides abscessus subsp. abscessus]